MAHTPSYDQQHLLTKLAQGDPRAFAQLFHYHFDDIYTAALRLLKDHDQAEDICQQVFTTLWEKRQELPSIQSLSNYLFIMARNLILHQFRKKTIAVKYTAHQLRQAAHFPANPEQVYTYQESKRLIDLAITNLPLKQQEAFRLSREKGLPHKDISLIMGISVATVKEHISKSLAFIRQFLAHHSSKLLPLAMAWLLK
jgi:RNA polymerase sigma-70 factor (ECF subfamily)